MPWPVYDGGSFSLYTNAIGLVENGAKLKVFAVNTPRHRIEPESLPEKFTEKTGFECHPIDTRIKAVNVLANLFSNRSYFVERFWDRFWNEMLIQILKKETFDVIQLEHSYLGLYIETLREHSSARIILRPQNTEYEVWRRIADKEKNPLRKILLNIAANRLYNFEKEIAAKVDGIIAISERDAGSFRKMSPGIPVIAVPVGFDFNKTGKSIQSKNENKPPLFYHLGSMDWIPNIQGIQWFLRDIMPGIIENHPEFRFRIAGKNMPKSLLKQQNDHLTVERNVADAASFHRENDVLIVPLLSGGGIRVKIIEAMALGKAVISTTIGAEGISYMNGENILIADTKEEFAEQVEKCIEEPARITSIGENGKLLAFENFNLRRTTGRMIGFYEYIIDV